jgi:hypothetical protein
MRIAGRRGALIGMLPERGFRSMFFEPPTP